VHKAANKAKRPTVGLGQLVTPATSLAAIAGAWLGPVTPDERAALLTAAAAASTLAAIRGPAKTPLRSERGARRPVDSSKECAGGPRIDDLEALIAAW